MRFVYSEEQLERAYYTASNEAEVSFNNASLYIEKIIQEARHVEIQVFGDKHGDVIHLNERECSIQRRNQKLIEEAPSPVVSPALRKKMGDTAILGAKAVNYVGPGTIEFLLDKDENFYFMEMNTRIQVEHPVTEESLTVDLIKEQIRVADGKNYLMELLNLVFIQSNVELTQKTQKMISDLHQVKLLLFISLVVEE